MKKVSPITSAILKTKTTHWFRSNMGQSNFATIGEYLSALRNIARLSGHVWLIDRCCEEVGAVSEEDYEIVVDTLIELARQELCRT